MVITQIYIYQYFKHFSLVFNVRNNIILFYTVFADLKNLSIIQIEQKYKLR